MLNKWEIESQSNLSFLTILVLHVYYFVNYSYYLKPFFQHISDIFIEYTITVYLDGFQ